MYFIFFPIFIQVTCIISVISMYTSRVENSVNPDQLASEKPADLDSQCFQNSIHLDSAS